MTQKPDSRRALFLASFDPVTNGHLDLIRRAHRVFPDLVVAVGTNVAKPGTFDLDARLDMLRTALADLPDVEVTHFDGLMVDLARQMDANVVIRGLRAIADFEYEFEMALMNKHLNPDVETVFMMTSQEFFYVSSSRLKELVHFGADVSAWVPPIVVKYLREKLSSS